MTNNDLQQASAWTRNYRNQNPTGTKAHCLTAETLQSILSQQNCVGVRAYYGLDDAGQPQLVLVGYDADDQYILAGPAEATRGAVMQESYPNAEGFQVATDLPVCPPCCSVANPLNS
ncbi:hypothetical protein J7E24_02230 [Hymenobacter sp. ISL-91]|uniref:hypothetical protein n=1 Tax=Hymenobacter sp. ISL-91 TaxID=2819151 RepID=UPI001BE891F9|nr:hypothetical protein [Hymenobacter sp. ISL-91]MBT2556588.1 hypothetical protein [Hymenobacter sp. ISL-91]